jgi:hypothetical protein
MGATSSLETLPPRAQAANMNSNMSLWGYLARLAVLLCDHL